MTIKPKLIGYACGYTPLPLIEAAGFAPYRILPDIDCADQAGRVLHDNLCPHVKRILDRALSDEVPELEGVVFMNSCDAMRRLYDAWLSVRPGQKAVLLDLPQTADDLSLSFFATELARLAETMTEWSGTVPDEAAIVASIRQYNEIASRLEELRSAMGANQPVIDAAGLQNIYNLAATSSFMETLEHLSNLDLNAESQLEAQGVPVLLFGNVLPDPEVFSFLAACGVRVIGEDLCTGSRMFRAIPLNPAEPVLQNLARGLLKGAACARTIDMTHPGRMADDIITKARTCGAQGVIGYTVKFCDPYLARLPYLRSSLLQERIPFLLLEGDCTLRSIGQQRTRVEAFIEMLRSN
jgi:benzoyl-CoA reductase/2-hydroxyglutaryl-CoA dehydratase subunit BcrC/BadD/HgdB